MTCDSLFTGDSLFMPNGGTARCDFPAATRPRCSNRSSACSRNCQKSTRVLFCHDYGAGVSAVACEATLGAQKRDNIHVRGGTDEVQFVALRRARDATLAMPALLLPVVQANIRAGALPPPDDNGVRYLKIPLARI